MSSTQTPANPALRRTEISVTLAVFVTVFATGKRLAQLPLRALIKDELGLPPETMASLFAVIGLAWYVKPLAGVLSDQLPLAGSRRKHYLIVSACGGALTWLIAGLMPISLTHLTIALVFVNLMAVLGNSVAGGLIVDAGREHRATGRLSALRVLAMNTGSMLVGPLGGWLAARSFSLTCSTGAGLMVFMAVAVAMLMDSDRVAPTARELGLPRRLHGLVEQFGRRRVWATALFTSAVYLAPSVSTIFYYFQRDTIGFDDQTIGLLASLNCLGGMLGAYVYMRRSARFTLRRLIVLGAFMCASCSLAYLGYDSLGTALVLEPIAGFCLVVGIMPIQELTARASPPNHEAFVFAAILSICNAAIAASDILGTQLVARFELGLQELIFINAASSLAALVFLPLVPRALLDHQEAEAAHSQ